MEDHILSETSPELLLAEQFVEQTDNHLYLTGKAGTGKTTFLKNLQLKSAKNVIVTAPTGVAAINAGGVTLHSFFQLPFGPYVPGSEIHERGSRSQFRFSKQKREILNRLDLLVIDEISMVRADTLDAVDTVMRLYRGIEEPFGGVQLLMIGDLHQLPPVAKPADWDLLRPYYDSFYFFSCQALRRTGFTTIELKHIYRQSDPKFIRILNQLRDNQLDPQSMLELGDRYLKGFTPEEDDGFIALTTHNAGAKKQNDSRLDDLEGEVRIYSAEVQGEFPENIYPAPDFLELKEGAQVMFLRNETSSDRVYFNGKIGKVERLGPEAIDIICPGESEAIRVQPVEWENTRYRLHPQTKKVEEEVIGTFKQFPLKLAWAITIHKSQGLTFDKAIIDAEGAFVHGQAYVALSRCRSLDGVVLSSPLSAYGIMPDRTLLGFDRHVRNHPPDQEQLRQAKIRFQQKLLLACFDFKQLKSTLQRVIRLFTQHDRSVTILGLEDLQRSIQPSDPDLFTVAQKFSDQLRRLFQQGDLPESDPMIRERLEKASDWFSEQLAQSISKPLEQLLVETDNTVVKAMVTEALVTLRREIDVKLAGIGALASGFNPSDYQRQITQALNRPAAPRTKSEKARLSKAEKKLKNAGLFARLKEWRVEKSETLDSPVHQVLRRSAMLEIVRVLPDSRTRLKQIKGVGSLTLNQSGDEIVAIVTDYQKEFGIKSEHAQKEKPTISETHRKTLDLFEMGLDVKEIAKRRGLVETTIETHLAAYLETGRISIDRLVPKEKQRTIAELLDGKETLSLSPMKKRLGEDYTYGEIKMVMADRSRSA